MDDTAEAIAYQNVMINQIYFLGMLIQLQEIDEMLTGLMSTEDEEEIIKELDELREQEVKFTDQGIYKKYG